MYATRLAHLNFLNLITVRVLCGKDKLWSLFYVIFSILLLVPLSYVQLTGITSNKSFMKSL
jgi:hypothetical protein